jgi:hypothetical protein
MANKRMSWASGIISARVDEKRVAKTFPKLANRVTPRGRQWDFSYWYVSERVRA